MYPTDEIYGEVFNFTDTEPLNTNFEDMGYEDQNFVFLTGSLLLNMVIIIT